VLARAAELFSYPGAKIGFTGGEPFLYRQLSSALHLFSKHGSKLSITTNGTVVREDVLDLLADFGVRIKVSIHGDKAYHDRLTGVQGAFDKAVRIIQLLISRGIKVVIQTNMHTENIGSFEDRVDFCKSLGIYELKVFQLIDQGRAREERWSSSRLSDPDFSNAIARLRERAEKLAWPLNIRPISWPNTGHYVLVLPSGELTANPLPNEQGFSIIGGLHLSHEELWQSYKFKEAHLRRYG
jgi:MoaA/NifB/PqqE/SkfB family radical SAM enzyme